MYYHQKAVGEGGGKLFEAQRHKTGVPGSVSSVCIQ